MLSRNYFATLVIFILILLTIFHCHFVHAKSSSSPTSSSCKNGNICIHGDCIDNDNGIKNGDSYCKCMPCWHGSHCDQFGKQ